MNPALTWDHSSPPKNKPGESLPNPPNLHSSHQFDLSVFSPAQTLIPSPTDELSTRQTALQIDVSLQTTLTSPLSVCIASTQKFARFRFSKSNPLIGNLPHARRIPNF